MSKLKYKITGFARFMMFMVVFVPLAYAGFTLFKGESPEQGFADLKNKVESLKDRIKGNKTSEEDAFQVQLQQKDEEIQKLREALFQCEQAKN